MTAKRPEPVGRIPSTDVLLFAISTATLALEIVQIRIFSYSINPVLVYMVVSLALLGFGLSGTVMALVPAIRRVDPGKGLAICLLGFAFGAVLSNWVFSRLSHLIAPELGISLVSPVVPLFLLFTVPYFFSGLAVALALLESAEGVGRRYFVNLVGSGVGCFTVYPFLNWLGAERIALGVALASALLGAIVCRSAARRWLPAASALVAVLAVAFAFGERALRFGPDDSDLLANAVAAIEESESRRIEPERVFSRWDPVGRIELFRFPDRYELFAGRAPSLFFTQDGGAGSILLGLGAHPDLARDLAGATVYGLAPSLRPEAEVLVIGPGGGPDLIAALAAGSRRVTGVEINGAAIAALEAHRAFLGLPPRESRRLRLLHEDGRAHVRRFEDRFDVIQMTGADTYATRVASGSILSENYLYTTEAFLDLLRALRPNGLLAITRFGPEPVKVLTTAIAALDLLDVEQPERHVALVKQGRMWVTTLVKKTPFSRADVARLNEVTAASAGNARRLSLPIYDTFGFGFDAPMRPYVYPGVVEGPSIYHAFLEARSIGRTAAWLAEQNLDYTPSSDDKPFFFQVYRPRWPSFGELFRGKAIGDYSWDVTQYVTLVIQLSIVSLLLILGPLLPLGRRGEPLRLAVPLSAVFFAVGAGFMFVEVGLMQRFTLFLGHPNYSVSTILFSMLVFSGVGSYASSRWRMGLRPTVGLAIGAIIAGILLFLPFSRLLFDSLLHLAIGWRIAIAVLVVAPLGFFMGVPFPALLRQTETSHRDLSPWVYGVNGFASVLGSLATIPISTVMGFSFTLRLGAAAYALALVGVLLSGWLAGWWPTSAPRDVRAPRDDRRRAA